MEDCVRAVRNGMAAAAQRIEGSRGDKERLLYVLAEIGEQAFVTSRYFRDAIEQLLSATGEGRSEALSTPLRGADEALVPETASVVQRAEGRGRERAAARSIRAGEVILTELPALWSLGKRRWRDRCQGCLGALPPVNYVPCQGGCQMHRFCSSTCQERFTRCVGWAGEAECGHVFSALLGEQALLAGRMARMLQAEGPAALTPAVAQAIALLECPLGSMDVDLLAELTATAVLVSRCYAIQGTGQALQALAGHPPDKARPQERATALVLACLGRVVANAVGLPAGRGDETGSPALVSLGQSPGPREGGQGAVETPQRVALGLFLHAALCNHSCSPNAAFASPGMHCAPGEPSPGLPCLLRLHALQPIAEGEPITVSYGPLAGAMPAQLRRAALLSQYGFVCDCQACMSEA